MSDRPKLGSTEEMRYFINIVENAGKKGLQISWLKNLPAAILAVLTAVGAFLSGIGTAYLAFFK